MPSRRDMPITMQTICVPITAQIVAGGRPESNPDCRPPVNAQIDDLSSEARRLDDLIASAVGQPCVFDQVTNSNGDSSLSPHEWWGPSTIEYGEQQGVDVRPFGTGDYYRPEPSLRVAFDGADTVSYWECLQRASDGSIRNCTFLASGTYSIDILGDARVMTFNNTPTQFDSLPVERVLVERDGRVAPGYRERAGVRTEIGFNDNATDALLSTLRIPVPFPR